MQNTISANTASKTLTVSVTDQPKKRPAFSSKKARASVTASPRPSAKQIAEKLSSTTLPVTIFQKGTKTVFRAKALNKNLFAVDYKITSSSRDKREPKRVLEGSFIMNTKNGRIYLNRNLDKKKQSVYTLPYIKSLGLMKGGIWTKTKSGTKNHKGSMKDLLRNTLTLKLNQLLRSL